MVLKDSKGQEVGTRLGDINDLPEEVRSQLSVAARKLNKGKGVKNTDCKKTSKTAMH